MEELRMVYQSMSPAAIFNSQWFVAFPVGHKNKL